MHVLLRPFYVLLLFLAADSQRGAGQGPVTDDRPYYDLIADIAPAQHQLAVEGSVTLPPAEARERIEFTIGRSAGPIEWRDGDGAVLTNATRHVRPGSPALWRIAGPFPAGRPLTLRFRYRITTPEPDGFLYIGPEISFGAANWYPEIAGVQPSGRLVLRTEAEGAMASVGRPEEPIRQGAVRTQTFRSAVPGVLVFALSPENAHHAVLAPDLSLTTLNQGRSLESWRTGLIGVRAALEAEFGPLPYPHIAVIEVPDAIAEKAGFGAFASAGAVFARSSLIDQPFNVPGFAHEFAHLWWGNHVQLAGTEGDFLLDEGLAQYGSMVATDRVLGAEAGMRYRRDGMPGFNESLYSATGYLKINATGLDRPLLRLQNDGLSYWITYSKAGLVWYALAQDMGPSNFARALRAIVAERGGGNVSWGQFVAALQRQSDRPLEPFLNAWFRAPGAPDYRLDWRQEGDAVVGHIRQRAPPRPASLELRLVAENGEISRQMVRISGARASFHIPFVGRVRSVILDPDYKILRWTPELHAEARTMADAMTAGIFSRLGRSAEAEQGWLAVLRRDPADDRYDRRLLTRANLVRLTEARGCNPCAVAHLRAALRIAPQRLDRLALTYLSLAQAARRLREPRLAAQAARLGRSADALVGNANGVAIKLGDDG